MIYLVKEAKRMGLVLDFKDFFLTMTTVTPIIKEMPKATVKRNSQGIGVWITTVTAIRALFPAIS